MKTKHLIIALIIILILGVIAFSTLTSATRKAYLTVNKGKVELYRHGEWIPVNGEVNIKEKDKIRTDNTGRAVLIIYDSYIMKIMPNTEIDIDSLLKQNITIHQKGTTWNKLLKMFGLNVNIDSDGIIASVRGTSFIINNSKGYNLIVAEGVVDVKQGEKLLKVKQLEKYKLTRDGLMLSNLSRQEKLLLLNQLVSTNQLLEQKQQELLKDKKLLIALKYSKVNNTMFRAFIQNTNQGLINEEEYIQKINEMPLSKEKKQKLIAITQDIRKNNELISILRQSLNQQVEK